MNYFQKILHITQNKKCIIYGAGRSGVGCFKEIEKAGRKVSYFVDMNQEKWNTKYMGVEVLSPYDLVYEDSDQIMVFISVGGNKSDIFLLLNQLGLEEDKNFCDVVKMRYKALNLWDSLLGYSRSDKIEGFDVLGNINGKNKVVTLGGSTTDPYLFGIKSWPEHLHELLSKEEEITVYNGGVVGYNSSQELLKTIRDVIILKPKVLCVLSGFNDVNAILSNGQYQINSKYMSQVLEDILYTKVECRNTEYKNNIDIDGVGRGIASEDNLAESWIKHMRMINSICQEFGIEFYAFLQPTCLLHQYNSYEKNEILGMYSEEEIDNVNKFYDEIIKKRSVYPFIFDFSELFINENVFLDSVHCEEKGNIILAKKVYETIVHE